MRLATLGKQVNAASHPLWLLDSKQSRTSIRGDVDHDSHPELPKACAVFWKASSMNRDRLDVGHQSGRRFDIGVLEP